MLQLTYTKANNLGALSDAFTAAGLIPIWLLAKGDQISVALPDGANQDQVDAIIAAHDPAALAAAELTAEAAEQAIDTERDAARAALIAQGAAAFQDLVQMQSDLAVFVTPAHNLSTATFANQAARDTALQNIGKALEPILRNMIRLAGIQQAILRLEAADHGLKVSP